MKVTFDIDCTPAEARAFFGLPDLTPVHDIYLEKLKGYVADGLTPADFEKLARAWMPGIADSFETFRNAFWNVGKPGAKAGG